MSQPDPIPRRDSFRFLDLLGTVWSSAAAIPSVSTGAAAAYRTLLVTIRQIIVGRRVTVRLDSGDLNMKVSRFDSRLDMRRLAVGQIDDLHIAADQISWGTSRFENLSAVLRNVHVRPGTPAMLVATPIQLALDVPAATFEDLLAGTGKPKSFRGEVGADGIARVHWTRRPAWGNVEIDAELDGSVLVLRPRAVMLGAQRWALPARTPGRRIRLPELPHGLQLTDVWFAPGLLRLSAILPRWQIEISRRRAEVLLYQLSTAGLLSLTRSGLRSATGQRRTNRDAQGEK